MVDDLRRRLDDKLWQYKHLKRRRREEVAALKRVRRELRATRQAQSIAQTVGQLVQERAHGKIAEVVTRCLSAVFDEAYQFRIVFEKKRGRTEARPCYFKNGREIHPRDGEAGGILDVTAFALRLACVLICKPPLRRLLVLDEPFRHLKPPALYGPRVCRLLHALAKELDVQFVIVQNVPEFITGKVVEL